MVDQAGPERRAGARRHRAVVVCPPGAEDACRQELLDLGVKPKPAGPGTFELDATTRQVYAANLWLRTASRVLVRAATFRATDFAHLLAGAEEVPWEAWLADGVAPVFRVSTRDSKLYHTEAIAERLHQVVGLPSEDDDQPRQLFVVRVERNTVTISADASGDALHHRAWRTGIGPAPLRTTLAAAMLRACGWDGTVGLVDPFCGVGTIPIEAALLARNLPPGGDRTFAFQDWPSFEAGTWASVAGAAAAAARPAATTAAADGAEVPLVIAGSDRDPEMTALAGANAERAGVAADVTFETRVVAHLRARPGAGLVLTNPPFGKRLGDARLDGLYRRFGTVANQRLAGWDLAVLATDRKLVGLVDRRLRPAARFGQGGLAVTLWHRPAAPADASDAPGGPSGQADADERDQADATGQAGDADQADPAGTGSGAGSAAGQRDLVAGGGGEQEG